MGDRTSISVSHDLADDLYERKKRGESYEDLIRRILEEYDADDEPAAESEQAEG